MERFNNLYDDAGRVQNPKIAHEMAKIEDPYHKKRLGIFPASKKSIMEGETTGENKGMEIVKMLEEARGLELSFNDQQNLWRITGEVKGHKLDVFHSFGFVPSFGTIDGRPLSNSDASKLANRYDHILRGAYSIDRGEKEIVDQAVKDIFE